MLNTDKGSRVRTAWDNRTESSTMPGNLSAYDRKSNEKILQIDNKFLITV